ncbi:MAG: hypothetical protein R3343_05615 [Nitriliruptorales bacterium]|nr:hypothetical protein [Nitriliruptorales bacterium]
MDDLDPILTDTLRPDLPPPPPVEEIRARGRHIRRRRQIAYTAASVAAIVLVVGTGMALQSWMVDNDVVVDPVGPDTPTGDAPAGDDPSKVDASEATGPEPSQREGVALPAGDLIVHQRAFDIYAVTLEGEEIPIFQAPTIEVSPDVSPDGQRILFSSGDGDNFDLFVMAIDGTDVTQLTDTPTDPEFEARWSPDGTRIVYMRRNVAEERSEIWTMRADGSGQTALYTDADASLVPTWSPDGSAIAFTSYVGESFDVWIMDADGSDARRVTDLPNDEWNSVWSPDGRFLTFSAHPDGGDRDLYVVEVESGEVSLLLDTELDATGPMWHPNGTRLAYELNRQIWLVAVSATGSGFEVGDPVRVTTSPEQHGAPTWRVGG